MEKELEEEERRRRVYQSEEEREWEQEEGDGSVVKERVRRRSCWSSPKSASECTSEAPPVRRPKEVVDGVWEGVCVAAWKRGVEGEEWE